MATRKQKNKPPRDETQTPLGKEFARLKSMFFANPAHLTIQARHTVDVKDLAIWTASAGDKKWGVGSRTIVPNPLVTANLLICSIRDPGKVIAFDRLTGATRWSLPLNDVGADGIIAGPADRGLVYGGTRKELLAMEAATGRVVWSFSPWRSNRELIDSTPAVAGDRLFVGDRFGFFHCLEAATGKPLWQACPSRALNNEINSEPVVFGGVVAVGTNAGLALGYDTTSGKELWRHRLNGPCTTVTESGEGKVLLWTQGTAYLLEISSGEELTRWSRRNHAIDQACIARELTLLVTRRLWGRARQLWPFGHLRAYREGSELYAHSYPLWQGTTFRYEPATHRVYEATWRGIGVLNAESGEREVFIDFSRDAPSLPRKVHQPSLVDGQIYVITSDSQVFSLKHPERPPASLPSSTNLSGCRPAHDSPLPGVSQGKRKGDEARTPARRGKAAPPSWNSPDPFRDAFKAPRTIPARNLAIWTATIDGATRPNLPGHLPNPTVVSDLVIHSTMSPGRIVAFDRKTGAIRWSLQLRYLGNNAITPGLPGSGLIYGGTCQEMLAIEAVTGRIVWSFAPYGLKREPIYSSPGLKDGRLFLGDRSGHLHCLDAATGKTIWRILASRADNNDVNCNPLPHEGMVIVGTNSGLALAFDVLSGKKIWRQKLAGAGCEPVAVAAGKVLVNTRTTASLLSVMDGSVLWRWNRRHHEIEQAAFAGDLILMLTAWLTDKNPWRMPIVHLRAIRDGVEIYAQPYPRAVGTTIGYSPETGRVYESTRLGLGILDPQIGTRKTIIAFKPRYSRGNGGHPHQPSVIDGRIYAVADDGEAYALRHP